MTPRMPPLPERYAVLPKLVLPEVHGMGGNTVVFKEEDAFTRDQLLSAQRAAWNAAIEAAAEEAEALRSNEKAANMTARELITNDAAEEIASAIRSLKEPGHE